MFSSTRRLRLYCLLLLLLALAVGGLALGLLAREQTRLAEREAAAAESRRAAVESRARLIAENIELLFGDVQAVLLATLQEAPAEEPRPFLAEWRAGNPLVLDVFRATAEGRPIWGAEVSAAVRAWLAEGAPRSDERALGEAAVGAVLTRADRAADFVPAEPLRVGSDEAGGAPPVAQAYEARGEITSNVRQYQRARQEIQEVAKLRGVEGATVSAPAAPALMPVPASATLDPVATSAPSPGLSASFAQALPPAENKAADAFVFGDMVAEGEAAAEPGVVAGMAAPAVAGRSGWTAWRGTDGPHLFGWRELPDRTVVGLELRLDAIKARLGEVFPAAPEAGEAYALRDAAGTIWHRSGDAALPVVAEVPLTLAALPGWSVLGARAEDYAAAGGGVFWSGAALVALLVLAILAAGALLVRQARASEAEAALKTSFVANVSHELKTPLTTIRLYAELLAQGRVREEAKRIDYLATIGRETERLGRLVGNVLDFSRLEQGKKKYVLARSDLAAALRRVAEVHAPRLAEAGLSLHWWGGDEPVWVRTDLEAVEQIVLNLLDNAAKYAADGGEVALELADRREGGVAVGVLDRGPGVPGDQHQRIFEKFHRVDNRLTAEKSGAGLGLSIARQLARGLGGDLRCATRADGGAAFTLLLPGPVERGPSPS